MLHSLLLSATLATAPESLCSHPLFRVDPEGRPLQGTKESVLTAFRAGLPLRVSWSIDVDFDGAPDVTNWADAAFLSDFEGEVFA